MLGFLSQQNTKCLTDQVKHDTGFVTYLKMSGRLESWRPLGWVNISLVLAPHKLRKPLQEDYYYHTCETPGAVVKGSESFAEANAQEGCDQTQGTQGHTRGCGWFWSHLLRLGQLHGICEVPCGIEHPSPLTAWLKNMNTSKKAKESPQTCVLNPHTKATG